MRKYFTARVLGINNAYDVARQLFGNRDAARRGTNSNLTIIDVIIIISSKLLYLQTRLPIVAA